MKSESLSARFWRAVASAASLRLARRLARDGVSALDRNVAVSMIAYEVLKETQSTDVPHGLVRRDGMNPTLARDLTGMRYPQHIKAVEDAARSLSAAAWEEDPYVYTECTNKALTAVLAGMGKTLGALLGWLEENPVGKLHNHSVVFTTVSCLCDKCNAAAQGVLEELYASIEKDVSEHASRREAYRERGADHDQQPRTLQ